MNRTFSIIKPDATKRNITGSINKIIEKLWAQQTLTMLMMELSENYMD